VQDQREKEREFTLRPKDPYISTVVITRRLIEVRVSEIQREPFGSLF